MPTLQTCRRWNSASPIDSVEGEVSVSAIFRSPTTNGGHVITTCCAVIPINPLLTYTLTHCFGSLEKNRLNMLKMLKTTIFLAVLTVLALGCDGKWEDCTKFMSSFLTCELRARLVGLN